MSGRENVNEWDRAETARPDDGPDGTETVESYEVDDGVVLFDSQNPLAWVEASVTIRLHEHV
jgi:hypothetical protein